jgi:hypothetical protein
MLITVNLMEDIITCPLICMYVSDCFVVLTVA